ncbi:hypothetical protein Taro_050104, partial [Colocasia esculenta]|nr:hypothetical protein [Colocasia esculenta]
MSFSHGCSVSLVVTPGCSFPTLWRSGMLVVRFPTRYECELQESVAAVAGCTCFKRGCSFAHAAVGFVISLCIRVGVSRRLREPACGVAFTGAGLWSAEPGCVLVGCPLLVRVCPSWMSPCCRGVCCWLCVWPCVSVRHWALCSAHSTSLLELSRCFVCRVAPLVERCDTCLWLLSAWCWLVVNSGVVLLEFFSIGSGGGE